MKHPEFAPISIGHRIICWMLLLACLAYFFFSVVGMVVSYKWVREKLGSETLTAQAVNPTQSQSIPNEKLTSTNVPKELAREAYELGVREGAIVLLQDHGKFITSDDIITAAKKYGKEHSAKLGWLYDKP